MTRILDDFSHAEPDPERNRRRGDKSFVSRVETPFDIPRSFRRVGFSLVLVFLFFLSTSCAANSQTDPAPLSPETLHLAWEKDTGGVIQQPPLSVKDALVVMVGKNLIRTFDRQSGESRWQLDTPAKLWPDSLSTTLDAVMIGGENGRLVAMSAKSGIGEWELDLGAEVISPPLVDRYVVFAATALVDPSQGHDSDQKAELLAINASTGKILWQQETDNHSLVTPARGGDMVYAGGSQGEITRLYAFSAAEGEIRWKYESVEGAIEAVYANDEVVVLLGEQGILTAVDAISGTLLWQADFVASVSWLTGWENLIIFEDGANLLAWDILSGDPVWEYQTPEKVVGKPIILNAELYLLTQAGEIINLNPKTGSESWRFPTKSRSPAGMVISQGWIMIADETGQLFAYQSQ